MIAALLLMLAAEPAKPPASIDGLPIGGLEKQALPATGCAAYLFSTGATRIFVAMASANPATLRIALDGKAADYARASQDGDASFGFAHTAVYKAGDVTAALDMTITTRGDLTKGAVVSEAILRVDRPGKDGLVIPMAGLIGCA